MRIVKTHNEDMKRLIKFLFPNIVNELFTEAIEDMFHEQKEKWGKLMFRFERDEGIYEINIRCIKKIGQ